MPAKGSVQSLALIRQYHLWVDKVAVAQHFEMQMVANGQARCAYGSDDVALRNAIPFLDVDAKEVRISRPGIPFQASALVDATTRSVEESVPWVFGLGCRRCPPAFAALATEPADVVLELYEQII